MATEFCCAFNRCQGTCWRSSKDRCIPLYRLEHQGFIRSEWGVSENNRKAKFYRLSPAGTKRLRVETEQWDLLKLAVGNVLGTLPEEV